MISRHPIHYGQFDTPEELFSINSEAEPGLYLDALNCTLARADAVATLMAVARSDLADGYSVDQRTVADGVWTLCGLIETARTITGNVK
jgi:hypothetical protein